MLSRQDLARLGALRSDEGIVSVYLSIDPHLMYDRGHPAAEFKGAAKRLIQRTQDSRWLAVLEREKGRILDFLEGWQPRGRGLVIFSSSPAGIWEVLNLGVPVPSFVDVDATTHTGILAQVLDEYPRFVVALVEADKARIYVAEQGSHQRQAEIASEVPGWHDQGGWSQARFQRHIEFHTAGHLKRVAEELERLYHRRPFKRLALGGTETTVHELQRLLPQDLARRPVGAFPVNFKHESDEEALARARRLLVEDERRAERELVSRIVDAAHSGGHGAVGFDDTIAAVREGRVRTLVVAQGVTREGSACTRCDYFAARPLQRCPLCGGPAEPAPDIVERTIERAYLSGAEVNVVLGEAREWLLARGGLGAVLRY